MFEQISKEITLALYAECTKTLGIAVSCCTATKKWFLRLDAGIPDSQMTRYELMSGGAKTGWPPHRMPLIRVLRRFESRRDTQFRTPVAHVPKCKI
jgi:hypothetical protein